ncbi:MAG: hypothetical protein K5765_04665 [Clostridia bacterium]|nr:hypothetical protein [Clostridia bacterium]
MWLNDKEEKIYGPFSDYIEKNIQQRFRFIYADGVELIVEFFTDYESENGLELDDKNYEEYWESAFKILEVVKDDKNTHEVGKYVIVNYHCIPVTYEVVK